MKIRLFVVIAGLIVLAVAGAAGWYLVSPLFIDNVVDEEFPFEQAAEAAASRTNSEQMEANVEEVSAAVPEPEEMPAAAESEVMAEEAEAEAMPEAAEMEVEEAVSEENMEAMPEEVEEKDMPESAEMKVEEVVSEDNMAEMEQESSGADRPVAMLQGQFQDADRFHQGSGEATIYQLPDGSHVLRFETFEVTNGPDLHVLLSTHPAPTNQEEVMAGYLDLGKLKGNVGSQNYDIPAGTDLSQFNSVVIYCEPFHVVFSTATLGN